MPATTNSARGAVITSSSSATASRITSTGVV